MAKRRHLSRIAVMQTVFEMRRRHGDSEAMLMHNIDELEEDNVDVAFAKILLVGTVQHWEKIIETIQTYAPQWPLERMDPVSRAILMMSAYEMLFNNDAPPAVVMDEAIEIAKEYAGAESSKFVNGVLNAIAKSNRKESK